MMIIYQYQKITDLFVLVFTEDEGHPEETEAEETETEWESARVVWGLHTL